MLNAVHKPSTVYANDINIHFHIYALSSASHARFFFRF